MVAQRTTVFFLLFVCLGISFADRKVTTTFYTQSEVNSTSVNIGHVEAKGSGDTLHYLFSTEGIPTVIVVRTKTTAKLKIGPGNISFEPPTDVLYEYGIAFSRLIEYNDTKDKADMTKYDSNDGSYFGTYNFQEFSWENMTAQSKAAENIVLMNVSHSYLNDVLDTNGSITLKFKAFGDLGREDQLPHLQYNENITQFDLSIDHIRANFSKSRFALELIMVGKDLGGMKLDETRSIDDEYCPGVFTINNWLVTPAASSSTGFFQWKPVCYKSMSRARSVATGMKHYGLKPLTADQNEQINSSILNWFYGNRLPKVTGQAMNFSFGLSQDGGYNKSQELTWSASIGYGTPPKDSVSTVVIIIIAAGLGIPAIIIILGGIYVCVKKRKSKDPKPLQSIQNGYQPLPSDE